MFRHTGKARTFKHNIRLAGMLSFIAGLVNISGVLSVNTLTTNVTGHFAFFAEHLEQKQFATALTFLLYISAFFFGSFLSSLMAELSLSKGYKTAYVGPMMCEIGILLFLGIAGDSLLRSGVSGTSIAVLLLFAMGLQNALVTRVSKSVVRTTHLTGLFTDLGIELAQLFFYRKAEQQRALRRRVHLKLVIIFFFFWGCVIGGFLYNALTLGSLLVASGLLAAAFTYDTLKFMYYRLLRGSHRG